MVECRSEKGLSPPIGAGEGFQDHRGEGHQEGGKATKELSKSWRYLGKKAPLEIRRGNTFA